MTPIPGHVRPIPLRTLLAIAAAETGASLDQIAGLMRDATVLRARQVACWTARKYGAGATTTAIGHILNRDHSTVLHNAKTIEARRAVDAKLQALCDRIMDALDAWYPAAPQPVPTPAPIAKAKPKSAPDVPCAVVRLLPANADADLPAELYGHDVGASRNHRNYLLKQDEAFLAAMKAAGYAETK